jgi:hypothetical protein
MARAKVSVKGKEVALPTLPLTLQPEVVLQLSNSEGQCWQSSFSVAKENDESRFTAKEEAATSRDAPERAGSVPPPFHTGWNRAVRGTPRKHRGPGRNFLPIGRFWPLC